eukprot:Skav212197  [mRNA]  locus=scaffold754:611529:612656:- [translate_table: standard]
MPQCHKMLCLLPALLPWLGAANILEFDTLPVNAEGTWFGTGSLHAKYACSDPSTTAGLEECLTVLLAPKGLTSDYLTLVYEAPALTTANGTKTTLVPVDGSTVKVKVGENIPQMSPVDESLDGEGSEWNGILIATDFAWPWDTSKSAIEMMLSQLIISNGFSARMMPMFNYANDGVVDDDGCLGPVNNTPGFNADTPEEKCPGTKDLTSGMYKYTFFAYQAPELDCENCTLTFRNRIDVGIFTMITINKDQSLDTIGTTPVTSIHFGAPDGTVVNASNETLMYMDIDLPTLVTIGRKDSQVSYPNGATVTVTKISDTSFYLDFAMMAPGPNQMAFYDPDVTGQGPEESSDVGLANFGMLSFGLLFLLSGFHFNHD